MSWGHIFLSLLYFLLFCLLLVKDTFFYLLHLPLFCLHWWIEGTFFYLIIIIIIIIFIWRPSWSSDHSRRTLAHVNFFTLTVTVTVFLLYLLFFRLWVNWWSILYLSCISSFFAYGWIDGTFFISPVSPTLFCPIDGTFFPLIWIFACGLFCLSFVIACLELFYTIVLVLILFLSLILPYYLSSPTTVCIRMHKNVFARMLKIL